MIKRGLLTNKKATRAGIFNIIPRQIVKSKRSTRVGIFNTNSNFVKSKRSQGIMGLPFSVIFSIFLIIFFIVIAFIAIKYFLGWSSCGNVGLFLEDFQNEVDDLWKNDGSFEFSSTLPSGIEYVCFANFSDRKSSVGIESDIYDEFKAYEGRQLYNSNMFLYPIEKACDMEFKTINHMEFSGGNPLCIPVENGKIKIKLEKGLRDALVKVGR